MGLLLWPVFMCAAGVCGCVLRFVMIGSPPAVAAVPGVVGLGRGVL